jgi:hypothetical protein
VRVAHRQNVFHVTAQQSRRDELFPAFHEEAGQETSENDEKL